MGVIHQAHQRFVAGHVRHKLRTARPIKKRSGAVPPANPNAVRNASR